MGAFDTTFAPKSVTPANTIEAALFVAGTDSTSSQDVSCLVTVVSVDGEPAAKAWLGIKPSGGSTAWQFLDGVNVPDGNALGPDSFGTITLRSGDAIQIKSSVANALTFGVTGVESS